VIKQVRFCNHSRLPDRNSKRLIQRRSLSIRKIVAQAETITPLGDLTDFAELAG
jgi:hypothetical protein